MFRSLDVIGYLWQRTCDIAT